MNKNTKKIVMSAVFIALTCVATLLIKIPSPLKGYINFGDCIVLLVGWMLSPAYAFLAAGLGSMFADVFLGYITYAPATFLIKGLMAIIAFYIFKLIHHKIGNTLSRIISAVLAEVFMVLGYWVFEGFLYGFIPSIINIPANCVQGIVGIILSVILIKIFEKSKIKLQ